VTTRNTISARVKDGDIVSASLVNRGITVKEQSGHSLAAAYALAAKSHRDEAIEATQSIVAAVESAADSASDAETSNQEAAEMLNQVSSSATAAGEKAAESLASANTANTLRGETQTLRDQAEEFRDQVSTSATVVGEKSAEALNSANTAGGFKDDTQNLRNEAEGFRDQAQASAGSVTSVDGLQGMVDLSVRYVAIGGTAYDTDRLGGQLPAFYARADNLLTPVPLGALFTDTVYVHPSTHLISEVDGLASALLAKLDASRVQTDVPPGAVFTDTDTVYSHPAAHSIAEVTGLQSALDNINSVLLSDDATLDQIQEVVDFIKINRSTLDALGISSIAGLQAALDGKLGATAQAADSAKLGGAVASTDESNSTIVKRTSSGYVFAKYFNTSSGFRTTTPVTAFFIETGSDGYIRKMTAADALTQLGALAVGAKAADSQLLDGVNGASYARSDATDTISGVHTHTNTLNMKDSKLLTFGTGGDAEFFCNGSHMYTDLNSGIGNWYIRDGSTTRFTFDDAGHFTATGNVTAYSDVRIKANFEPIDNALEKVCALEGVTYTRTDYEEDETEELTRRHGGYKAQQVQAVLPEAVYQNDDERGTLSVDDSALTGLLIEAVKELKSELDEVRGEVFDGR